MQIKENLIEKINILPPQKQAEVEDFVDFLTQKEEQKLVQTAMRMSEKSFEKVWDNEEDAVYDEL
jgi:ABC-type glycerol-3-phosphate transport system substrate-binding protein